MPTQKIIPSGPTKQIGNLAARVRGLVAQGEQLIAEAKAANEVLSDMFRAQGLNPNVHVLHTDATTPLPNGTVLVHGGVYERTTGQALGEDLRPLTAEKPASVNRTTRRKTARRR